MVGRAGRSKACFMCRKRRLGCDETKPYCLRCKIAGLNCTGYPEPLQFIDDNPAARLQKNRRNKPSVPDLEKPQVALSVLGDDLYFAFLRRELRNGDTLLDGRWPGFAALQMPDGLSRQSITSFAASFFGRRRGSEKAREEGLELYAKSLRELNDRLSQPQDSSAAQTVLAIGILTVCECLTATSGTAWIEHMLGLAAYFRLRRFAMFSERYVLEQFETQRCSMILAAVAARQPTCFALDEWLTMPWICAGMKKNLRQNLLDHTAQLPNAYLDFIAYLKIADVEKQVTAKIKLERNLTALLHNLRKWKLQWDLEEIAHVKESRLSEDEQKRYGIASKLVFDDIDEAAFTFMMYNFTLIILLELWKRFRKVQAAPLKRSESENRAQLLPMPKTSIIETSEHDHQHYNKPPTTESLTHQSRNAALDICRALLLFQSPTGSWINTIQLVVPVRMALVVFRQDRDSPQVAWLEDIHRQVGESRQGWEIGRYTMQEYGYS